MRPLLRFVAVRSGLALLTLFLFVTTAFFFVSTVMPFDYATQFWFSGGTSAMLEARERLGLNRPLWEQYLSFLGDLTTGGLGSSLSGESVGALVAAGLPTTLLVFGTGGVVAFLLGSWLGKLIAWRQNRLLVGAASTLSVFLYSAFPPWLVFLLVYVGTTPLVSLRFWLDMPYDSQAIWRDVPFGESDLLRVAGISLFLALVVSLLARGWAQRREIPMVGILALPAALIGVVVAIVLLGYGQPALDVLVFRSQRSYAIGPGSPILAFVAFVLLAYGEIMFVVRTGVEAELGEDYVVTARAKGLSPERVLNRHIARNAVLPVLSRTFTGVPYILTGLLVIESQFALPGLSSLFFGSVRTVDTPLVLGVLVVLGVVTLGLRLFLDLLHAVLDPRIRLGFQR